MSKTVDIGTLSTGDPCIMDNNKIGKIMVQLPCELTKEEHETFPRKTLCRCKTKFENELGNIDWVWSHYKVTVD